jgi:hypothetical protein
MYIQIASISHTKFMRVVSYVISGAVAFWWSRLVPSSPNFVQGASLGVSYPPSVDLSVQERPHESAILMRKSYSTTLI